MKPIRKPIARGSGVYRNIRVNHFILVVLGKETRVYLCEHDRLAEKACLALLHAQKIRDVSDGSQGPMSGMFDNGDRELT